MLYLVILIGWGAFDAYSFFTMLVLMVATALWSKSKFSIVTVKN